MPGRLDRRAGAALQLLGLGEQLRRTEPQRVGHAPDVRVAGVALAALDSAEVRAVHAAAVRQLLLRQVALDPEAADGATQRGGGGGPLWHRPNVAAGCLCVYSL